LKDGSNFDKDVQGKGTVEKTGITESKIYELYQENDKPSP
jgi:predicted DNA-binding transcriptional regulator AlpA